MFGNIKSTFPSIMNKVSIKPCTGGIYKSHPKSHIVRTHINSIDAASMLAGNPKQGEKDIVVLQVVNSVEGYILVEYMEKQDYEAENIEIKLEEDKIK